MVKHRRKLSEQEGGTSKFGKVALNWAISSAFEHQSCVTAVCLIDINYDTLLSNCV